jgi:hypothetical protein
LAAWKTGEGAWQPEAEILKVDSAVRKEFKLAPRGGEMVQPWYRNQQQPAPVTNGVVHLAFRFHVESLPKTPVSLAVERPALWKIQLNGHVVATSSPKDVSGWWVDPALQTLPLKPAWLQTGENRVELEVPFTEAVNLESLYLLGEFGVRLDGEKKTLTALPATLQAGDLAAQGLPFYSGPVSYFLSPAKAPARGQRVFVETPSFEAACVKVRSGKRPARMIAWAPQEAEVTEAAAGGEVIELEVVLTRRNTFGPLHLVPLRSDAYGPGHWTTSGASWSANYMLYPSGLLEAPVLSYRK